LEALILRRLPFGQLDEQDFLSFEKILPLQVVDLVGSRHYFKSKSKTSEGPHSLAHFLPSDDILLSQILQYFI
jgi:hypothetical protein